MRTIRLAVLTAAGLLVAACSPGVPPPPPANAEALASGGAYDERLDDVTLELRDALEVRYGTLNVRAYRLPSPTAWPSVNAYYQGALSAWNAETTVPNAVHGAHGRAWTNGRAVFAVALIDKPVPGEDRDYKVLVVARNRR